MCHTKAGSGRIISVQFYATRFTQQTSFDNFRSDAQRAEKQKQAKERELEHAAFSADRIEEGGFPPVSMVSCFPFYEIEIFKCFKNWDLSRYLLISRWFRLFVYVSSLSLMESVNSNESICF